MKKITSVIACFVIILVFGSCPNPFTAKPQPTADGLSLPDGYGAVQVSLVTGSARTALPSVDGLELVYKFYFQKFDEESGEYEFCDLGDNDERNSEDFLPFLFPLQAGAYKLKVEAYHSDDYADGEGGLVARGESDGDIVVSASGTTPCTVSLYPIVEEGEMGTLQFKINYTGIATVIRILDCSLIKIFPYDYENMIEDIKEIKIQDSYTYSDEIPSGFYLLNVKLKNTTDWSFASKSEVVHIYKNMVTVKEFNFTDSNFISNIVFDNRDYLVSEPLIPGTLRFAIDVAASGDVISVMLPPGSVIKLENNLLISGKNLTIEGNGVTLMPFNSGVNSGLMSLTNSNLKISRVRFKDGYNESANPPGGAISITDASSTLTLESCIFNENKTVGDYRGGGAIFNAGGTLIVKGCTFYGNSVSENGQGGAIYSTGSLTLAGNLFYGNTAVPPITGAGKVPSSVAVSSVIPISFLNASDVFYNGFGDGINGNILLTAPAVAPVSLKLLDYEGNQAAGVIASFYASTYPKKDFYGDTISYVNGAAVGAVQAATESNGVYVAAGAGVSICDGAPDDEGLYSENVSFEFDITLGSGQSICWLANGEVRESDMGEENQLTLSVDSYIETGYVKVEAFIVDEAVTSWMDLESAITSATGEKVILIEGDLTNGNGAYSCILVDKKITLVSKSHVIIQRDGVYDGTFFEVNEYGSLILGLLGLSDESCTITLDGERGGNEPSIKVNYGGTLVMNDGVTLKNNGNDVLIQFGGAVKVGDSGDFFMYGGEISGNEAQSGGGVYVGENGCFEMHGGKISGNKAMGSSLAYGGGVYVVGSTENGYFTMYGGEISENTAGNSGGGVYVGYNGIFTMIKGTIKLNETVNEVYELGGGGVYVSSNGAFTMKDGSEISDNMSTAGGGVFAAGTFIMNGGIISANSAYSTSYANNNSFVRGGGVFVSKTGSFTKELSDNSGIIYGSDVTNGLGNFASSYGVAVYMQKNGSTSFDNVDNKGLDVTVWGNVTIDESGDIDGLDWDYWFQ